ncbi:MAG: PAS domain S-box protein, partial [Burkholderiaceae bacterium]|nr:PAS domain S-box protein [Burkholderiaceae bacterium]
MAPPRIRTRGWLALLVGLTVVAATVGMWRALIAQERTETRREVALELESLRSEVGSGVDGRIMALVRMARRLGAGGEPSRSEWESDARSYLSHYTGYLAIGVVDPDLRVRWLVRHEASGEALDTDLVGERQQQALQLARLERRITLTQASDPSTAEAVMLINVPVFRDETFSGYVVGMFHVQSMLDSILPPSIAPRYAVAVSDGVNEIYRRAGGAAEPAGDWAQEAAVGLRGISWRLRAWPREEVLRHRSPLPQAVLAGGLSLALLLAAVVRFAQVAHVRAQEVEKANRELEHVIAEHQQTNESLRKLSRAVEQSPSLVLITDRHGAIEYINPKFTQVSGYVLEEIADENPRLLKSGETDPEEYKRMWQTISGGGEWRGVLHDRKKN